MTTTTANGYDPAKGRPVTDSGDAHVHVHHPDPGPEVSQPAETDPEPTYTRAISRFALGDYAHRARNSVQLHAAEVADSVTDGEAPTYRPPTLAEAWAGCLADLKGSRWYIKPVDFLAALLLMAAILVVWLTVMALASPAGDTPSKPGLLRRRAALALVLAATAAYVIAGVAGAR